MLANYVLGTAWGGEWFPALAGGWRRLGAGPAHADVVHRARRTGEAGEARARFEHEARAAARAWLMV